MKAILIQISKKQSETFKVWRRLYYREKGSMSSSFSGAKLTVHNIIIGVRIKQKRQKEEITTYVIISLS